MSVAPASSEDTGPAVEVVSVVKNYGRVEALKGVDLSVGRGEMFALLGPNGAGKTTLFSILATLRAPTSGSARVLGRDVVKSRDAIRREMGIVFQEPAIEQRLSGRDNLMLMGLLYGLSMSGGRPPNSRAGTRRRSRAASAGSSSSPGPS
jgi:ABC-2 type transport system ATP-binding protein